jgi:sugar O-acyltransferase (sialic acid O-acetyltransferase NeuD family)
MSKLIVFGTGQTSDIVSYYLECDSEHEIVAYTVDQDHLQKQLHKSKPVIPFEEVQNRYPPAEYKMFVALGYFNLNKLRAEKYQEAKEKGYSLITYIHSKAGIIDTSGIGDNCFILEHQSIQAFSTIGNNCFIWSGVLIAHHCMVKDHCWITSEASIAGNSTIGERCFIGINATIGHMIAIGDDCMVGAGTLVTKSAGNGSVFIAKSTELYKLNSEQFQRITKMR